jgi:hypothetical protein
MNLLIKIELLIIFLLASISSIQAQIKINEVCPHPEQGKEQVELYYLPQTASSSGQTKQKSNQCLSEQLINLNKWQVWDQLSQPSKIYQFEETSLCPGDLTSFELYHKLNNDQDGLKLFNKTDQIIDNFDYTNSKPNYCWSRQPDGFGQFILSPNSIGSLNPTPIKTITPKAEPTSVPTKTLPSANNSNPNSSQKETVQLNKTSSPPTIRSQFKNNFEELKILDQKISNLFQNQEIKLATKKTPVQKELIYYQHKHISKYKLISVIIGGTLWLIIAFYLYEQLFNNS